MIRGVVVRAYHPWPSTERLPDEDLTIGLVDGSYSQQLPGMDNGLDLKFSGPVSAAIPRFARIQVWVDGELCWQGRRATIEKYGDYLQSLTAEGYGTASLKDQPFKSTDATQATMGAVLEVVVGQAAPDLSMGIGSEVVDTQVLHAPKEFNNRYPIDVLAQLLSEGATAGTTIDYVVDHDLRLLTSYRVPTFPPTYRVPALLVDDDSREAYGSAYVVFTAQDEGTARIPAHETSVIVDHLLTVEPEGGQINVSPVTELASITGTASIPSNQSSIVIVHSLGVTPTADQIKLTPGSDSSPLFGQASMGPSATSVVVNHGYGTTPDASQIKLTALVDTSPLGGTATIATGSTSVVVAHGYGRTPVLEQIKVSINTKLDGSAALWWFDTPTSTTFTIHVDGNPTATQSFSWTLDRGGQLSVDTLTPTHMTIHTARPLGTGNYVIAWEVDRSGHVWADSQDDTTFTIHSDRPRGQGTLLVGWEITLGLGWWLSNITDTTFTINVPKKPGGSGVTFSWSATVPGVTTSVATAPNWEEDNEITRVKVISGGTISAAMAYAMRDRELEFASGDHEKMNIPLGAGEGLLSYWGVPEPPHSVRAGETVWRRGFDQGQYIVRLQYALASRQLTLEVAEPTQDIHLDLHAARDQRERASRGVDIRGIPRRE